MLDLWLLKLTQGSADLSDETWSLAIEGLSESLRERPERLIVRRDTDGRPYLRDFPKVDFNLSHTSGYGLLAVSQGGRVGVDLQAIRPLDDPISLAAQIFGPVLTTRLAELEKNARVQKFFGLWVRAEALLKATGEALPGVTKPLNEEALWPGCEGIIDRKGRRWRVVDRQLDRDLFAAIAVEYTNPARLGFDLETLPK